MSMTWGDFNASEAMIASSNWIVKNRDFYTTIANHDFYG